MASDNTEAKYKFVALCWSIWVSRNDLIWNNKLWDPGNVKSLAVSLLNCWTNLFMHGEQSRGGNVHATATGNDLEDLIIIHVDAAVNPGEEKGYVAAVVYDGSGVFLAARSSSVRCLHDPHLAEAMAIKEALSWAMECGWRKVMVYSDCQLVCSLLKSRSLNLSYAGCVLKDCHNLKRHFDTVSFVFIPRSANKLAHALARAAISQSGPHCWFSNYPTCIQHLVIN
ncbi:uncharacterized protein LOC116006850 [Ipomoea triloba]|uniref:uncharacterized protein LOC116006850 n=1 Tax=Ipomoea triloba TaxID=35885 RepID=UPI00125DBA85|nr:uncharacterized protein LOC116006850 [Ipomoea triloba]